jgi:cellulose synthase/poly-beta-1,6-N-acetylglucosamine synthase-like glycosyltransferase
MMNIPELDTHAIIIFSLVALAGFWQLGYLIRRIRPVAFYKPASDEENTSLPPLSVVISARNEAENLEQFLPVVLEQDYPEFQVVVVNDCSEDDTGLVLARLKSRYPHLYTTQIEADKKFYHGKKMPLSLGIKAAKYDHLVLTDADCRPASDQWLKKMAASFGRTGTEMVLGVGNYQKQKGLTNLWIRYETFTIAIQYLGFALTGAPYMGTGRNLAYTRGLFNKTKGFRSHIYLPSGDDDLFIREAATAHNTNVCIDPEAHTDSVPPGNFKRWMLQKQRHLTTSVRYRPHIKAALISEPISREIFWILTIYSAFFPNFATVVLPFSFIVLMIKFLFWKMAAKKTGMGRIYRSMVLFDIIQPFILARAHFGNLTGSKKRKWK